ncbi:DUF3231 family protein [Neobacillus vireti]|uniref:DUF3231 family protein n=1 Tax=Neobacillus vireti TaxID=220686 RepID=UPI002FFF88E6
MQKNQRLASTEISNLWTHYMRETMAICISKYMVNIIKDIEIHNIFKTSLDVSQKHIEVLKDLFHKENYPVPKGFSEDDVNLKAPSLFTDKYCLFYILAMTMHGMQGYSLALSVSIRKDIRDFYNQCNSDAIDLFNKSMEVSLSKNLFEMPPFYSTPDKVDFINNLNYVTDVFGKRRTMNSIESGNIFFNLEKSIVTKAFLLAGQQVCEDKDVVKFMEKSIEVKNKHIGIFSNLLLNENLTTGHSLDTEITNSTTAPFSDKLFLFHAGFLLASAISYYGNASVSSMRADISVLCEKAIMTDLWVMLILVN